MFQFFCETDKLIYLTYIRNNWLKMLGAGPHLKLRRFKYTPIGWPFKIDGTKWNSLG
jgi:hypothetical protein